MKKISFLILSFIFCFSKSQVSFNEIEVFNDDSYQPRLFIDYKDINNDGYPELFFSSITNNYRDFFWLMNESGDFKNSPRINQASYSTKLINQLFDVNNDGLVDIIGTDGLNSRTYYWLENLGDNNFSGNWRFLINSSNINYFSTDLFYDYNDNGYYDYFVATTNGKVYKYTNLNGNGFSSPELVFSTDDTFLGHIESIKFIDFNNDGLKDLLIRSFFVQFDVYLNNGDDYFEYHIPIIQNANENYLNSFDFDGNSLEDFIYYRANNLSIRSFFYDDENDEYYHEDVVIDTPYTHTLNSAKLMSKLEDFNQDGLPDIFITTGPEGNGRSNLYYYENLGNFEFAEKVLIRDNNYRLNKIVVEDLNFDNKKDLLLISGHGTEVSGHGTEETRVVQLINESENDFTTEVVEQNFKSSDNSFFFDYNNDGKIDILNGRNNLLWYENKGNDEWSGRRFVKDVSSGLPGRNYNYQILDIDNDGLFDIISNKIRDDDYTVDPLGNYFSIYKNLGNEQFELIYYLENEPNQHWTNYAIFNDNSDNYPDIYYFNPSWGNGNTGYHVIKNNNGEFDPPIELTLLPEGTPFEQGSGDFKLADLNNDGLPEIIYIELGSGSNGSKIIYLENLGENTFYKKTLYSFSTYLPHYKIYTMDYDSDGDIDVVIANKYIEREMIILENNDMVFSKKVLDESVVVDDLIMFDVDDDGLLDFLSIGYAKDEYKNKIHYYKNLGNDNYEKHLINEFNSYYVYPEKIFKSRLYLFDKDSDGKLDIFVSCTDNNNTILTLYNTSTLEVIDQNERLNKTEVFPNPFSETINWKPNQLKDSYSVRIFDLTGKMIFENEIRENNLNLSFLGKGIYILKIDSDSFKIIKK